MNVHSANLGEKETERETHTERETERESTFVLVKQEQLNLALSWHPESLTSGARAVPGTLLIGIFVIVYFKTFTDP